MAVFFQPAQEGMVSVLYWATMPRPLDVKDRYLGSHLHALALAPNGVICRSSK